MLEQRQSGRAKLEIAADIATLVFIVVLLVVVARQQWTPELPGLTHKAAAVTPPRRVTQWPEVLAAVREPVDSQARMVVAVFLDVECPFCRQFEAELHKWRRTAPVRVAAVSLHFPLPQHRFARPAARALECARDQDGYDALLEQLLAKQDSLGLIQWRTFAERARMRDLRKFDACNASTGSIPGVEQGLSLGRALSITGTPAVLVNGYLYQSAPSVDELQRVARLIEQGRDPFGM